MSLLVYVVVLPVTRIVTVQEKDLFYFLKMVFYLTMEDEYTFPIIVLKMFQMK